MHVQLIAQTTFTPPADVPWQATNPGSDAESLIEFAGRACYQSWDKPNPNTAWNNDYVKHLIDVGHFSVLEHGVATFYIRGVSRSLSHELVRHRHFSYSQLSQRYVPAHDLELVEPQIIADDPQSHALFQTFAAQARHAYEELLARMNAIHAHLPDRSQRRKRARQAARAVLPNATTTELVMTGNLRAWRHLLELRGSVAADVEIRELACLLAVHLRDHFPFVFRDVNIVTVDSGDTVVEMQPTW